MIIVIPAYGRDYKSKKEIQKDIDENKDFTVSDISNSSYGRYCNKQDLLRDNYTAMRVRYSQLKKVAIFKIS